MSSSIREIRIERVEGTLMAVNSYVVDGPEGLVVVDGQLTVSDARAVRAVVDQFDRPVAGLVLTHGHPDHYAGAAIILDGLTAPIIATRSVAEVIERDDAEKDGIVGPMMGDEWPKIRRFADQIASSGESINVGGVEFSVRDLGAGESHADTLWTIGNDTVFCGDVAYNNMHAYLLDGRFREWLRVLADLGAEFDDEVKVLVGHGQPADKSVLARQADYVNTFIEVVQAHAGDNEAERRIAVVRRMRQLVSDDRLLFLMELSIEPVLGVLKTERNDS